MSRAALERLALGYGWKPAEWHLQLAEHIPHMAVYGIFRNVVLEEGFGHFGPDPSCVTISFEDDYQRGCAEPYIPSLAKALGKMVRVIGNRPVLKVVGGKAMFCGED